jgi:hypothetical protein
MTNTQQISINQTINISRGHDTMNAYTEQTQQVVRDRIRARELEAASERLASAAHATSTPSSFRRRIGRLLITTGRLVAGERASAGSSAARPAHRMAA